MIRRLLGLAAALALAAAAAAQPPTSVNFLAFQAYDVASASYIYGLYSKPKRGTGNILTSGSSTTTTEAVTGAGPFANFGLYDRITVLRTGLPTTRYLTGVGSIPTTVTVDSVWTLASTPFTYETFNSGTGAGVGWIDTGTCAGVTLQWGVSTLNATSVTLVAEGILRGGANTTAEVYSKAFTAVGSEFKELTIHVDRMRIGAKIASDGGVQAVDATLKCWN